MSRTSSVVEINGNKYDVATGRLIGAVKSVATAINPGGGKVLDGFTRRPPVALTTPKPTKTSTHATKQATISRRPSQAVHKQAQHSRTIMRQVVSRPKLKNTSAVTKPARPLRRFGVISSKRAFRAKTISKSSRINRFAVGRTSTSGTKDKKLETAAKEGELLTPSKRQTPRPPTKALAKPLPSMVTSVSHTQLERMLDHALARADTHKQTVRGHLKHKGPLGRIKRLPRWLSFGLIVIVLLSLCSFLAWYKVPQLSLKVAASRAHIDAAAPNYLPYGFALAGPASFRNGSVLSVLKTTSDRGVSLTLMQQSSNLDSESLAATSIPQGTPVQTSQVKGTTVYIYGQNNDATWVNKGVKYTIKNDARISSDELLKIAGGLE